MLALPVKFEIRKLAHGPSMPLLIDSPLTNSFLIAS
jgi:hypothetical protein